MRTITHKIPRLLYTAFFIGSPFHFIAKWVFGRGIELLKADSCAVPFYFRFDLGFSAKRGRFTPAESAARFSE